MRNDDDNREFRSALCRRLANDCLTAAHAVAKDFPCLEFKVDPASLGPGYGEAAGINLLHPSSGLESTSTPWLGSPLAAIKRSLREAAEDLNTLATTAPVGSYVVDGKLVILPENQK